MAASPRMPFRWDPGLSLGHLLTAVTVIGSVIWASAGISARTDSNDRQLGQMRTDVAAQLTELKANVTAQAVALRSEMTAQMAQLQASNDRQFSMVRSDIANIPGMKERVDGLEKHMDGIERQIAPLLSANAKNTADIENIIRRQIVK